MVTSLLLAAAIATAAPATDIRFEYEDGRVYVPVSATQHGKPVELGWFILDTGAAGIGIDTKVAQRLGLSVQAAGTQTGAGSGASSVGRAKGLPLRVDGVTLVPKDVLVMPLDALLAPSTGRPVAGVIGSQFFHEHAVELDRGRNLLRVDPPHVATGADLPATGRRSIPFELDGDLPAITATVRIQGAVTPLRLVVDLG